VYFTGTIIMALFKIGIVALAPFILMPFVSGLPNAQNSASDKTGVASMVGSTHVHDSVLYKTESDFPEFMKKYLLPVKPYMQVSNQTIAAL
jgi:hypothetical protein